MKKYDLLDAIGNVNDELVKDAKQKKKSNKKMWATLGSIAACLVLVIAIPVALNFFNLGGGDNGGEVDIHNVVFSVEDLNRPYKNISIISGELGYVWRWDESMIYEQYTEFELNGIKFNGCGREISADKIGNKIGEKTLTGYVNHPNDFPEGARHRAFDVYEIKNVSATRLVAVLMEDKYYVFTSSVYKPPSTWGGVLSEYGLTDILVFDRFKREQKGMDDEYYALSDDAYIWDVLSSCQDAPFTDAVGWHETNDNYISFTITSEHLGVYKNVLYVTELGYIWTNIFNGEYLYYIGTEAAEKIISYAMNNSTEAKDEPYRRAIVGTIVEITDEYMLVNDSVLCENPEDGISFKVMLNDVRISRYITSGAVKLNETVKVEYEGKIDVENGYVIYDAISANEAIIGGDGNVLIPE